MIDSKDALNRLRRANLLPSGAVLDDDELAATRAECELRIAAERGSATPETRTAEESLRPVLGSRSRWRPALVFAVAFATVVCVGAVVALFGGSGSVVLEPDVASEGISLQTDGNVAYIDDLVYYEDVGRSLETSVFLPAQGSGPWPVAIIYSEHRINAQNRVLARKIAERGAVVFAPVWVDEVPPTQTASGYLSGAMWDRAACAVGYAQAQAEALGGDPSHTTVIGDAGGEHPAAWVALGLADTSGCAAPMRFQPTGLVAGQSQWLFQQAQFDDAFMGEDGVGIESVNRFFDPEHWDSAEDLSVYLWATAWSSNSKEIDDPPSGDSWIWSRNPDGDIIEDLAAVGALDDGLITFSDNTRLMNLRMARAGLDVDYYESDAPGYSLDDVAFEAIWQVVSGR